jgi:16S rRNA C967 or C1407 C5-methylase (RsmB/RsmF family)
VISNFLAQNADFNLKDIEAIKQHAIGTGMYGTLPQRDFVDGVFVAVIKKKVA